MCTHNYTPVYLRYLLLFAIKCRTILEGQPRGARWAASLVPDDRFRLDVSIHSTATAIWPLLGGHPALNNPQNRIFGRALIDNLASTFNMKPSLCSTAAAHCTSSSRRNTVPRKKPSATVLFLFILILCGCCCCEQSKIANNQKRLNEQKFQKSLLLSERQSGGKSQIASHRGRRLELRAHPAVVRVELFTDRPIFSRIGQAAT